MQLRISDPKGVLDRSFITWLIDQIRDKILLSLNMQKLLAWDEYLNNNPVYKSIYKKKISTRDLIIAGSMNLIFTQSANAWSIFINPNTYAPGLDRVKLSSICKLINFGNFEIRNYPIFTDTFDYFAENIATYIDRYLDGFL